ncbi:uncharacterized protein LACBIDRAFT_315634 [Laccaria bicolor S238N-H82]|uniref:Predicted protein n=1 Tax=Laccaria bicolor (strain S238N-H82 / ATCC MYA-4686) TaxID=486041 RepID=B0D2T9_LACBS|nr:uncharacterized protein LACBIDRAFT_315634 [Laccaria bicolor S238N-H82]EDR11153.1 predicted protein [Laccaria bicolor S238N-H82]|eukprot:XP_001878454.1 predicted protein [Laccaria bicolor S238N-H82]
MIISSRTDIVLDMFVFRYEAFAVFAVIISGIRFGLEALHVPPCSCRCALPSFCVRKDHEPSPGLVLLTLLLTTLPVEIVQSWYHVVIPNKPRPNRRLTMALLRSLSHQFSLDRN